MIKQLLLFLLVILLDGNIAFAQSNPLTLDLQNTNLIEAIRAIAKLLPINIVISDKVEGLVTLYLRDAEPLEVLNLLLVSHHLARWQSGNIWYVAPQDELITRRKEEIKWRELSEALQPLKTETLQIKYGDAAEIAHFLQDSRTALISKRGSIRVDKRTNIIGIQDTAEHLQNIHRIIRQLDVAVKQIGITARLASVDSDQERALGIDFSVKTAEANTKGSPSTLEQGRRYGLAVARLADNALLDVKLSALENDGHAELISTPSLFTANQQTASIETGEEVPYQEVSESGGTGIVFKKAVLGLKVTPQILPGNRVILRLQINQDRPGNRLVLGVPTIRTRQITTSVLVNNGQTVVLGGIYETNDEDITQGIPFISQIPMIGKLFQMQNRQRNKRELLIFITPNIMRTT